MYNPCLKSLLVFSYGTGLVREGGASERGGARRELPSGADGDQIRGPCFVGCRKECEMGCTTTMYVFCYYICLLGLKFTKEKTVFLKITYFFMLKRSLLIRILQFFKIIINLNKPRSLLDFLLFFPFVILLI